MQEVRHDGTRGGGRPFTEAALAAALSKDNVKNMVVSRVPEVGREIEIDGLVYVVVRKRMDTKRVQLLFELK